MKTNTYRAETFCYTSRKVIRANRSKEQVKSSKMHLTLISRKCEVHFTPKVKEYITLVVCKSMLIKLSSVSNLILIVNKYNKVILSKFKTVKFMIE